jgi:hypothetical protein
MDSDQNAESPAPHIAVKPFESQPFRPVKDVVLEVTAGLDGSHDDVVSP